MRLRMPGKTQHNFIIVCTSIQHSIARPQKEMKGTANPRRLTLVRISELCFMCAYIMPWERFGPPALLMKSFRRLIFIKTATISKPLL